MLTTETELRLVIDLKNDFKMTLDTNSSSALSQNIEEDLKTADMVGELIELVNHTEELRGNQKTFIEQFKLA